ncbi:MAG: serine--tRNA ligase [Candidatus Altiarchaeales archaeon]|nr:serine--tRNA ligase [Candidatus Altiarchaeales archaeon]MBD3416933.1 serine--tRNA ligase [Candidatus Altiarchaeales archaeon]
MLELSFIRENAEVVEADLRKRGDEEKLKWVRELLEKDERWRVLKREADELRSSRNQLTAKVKDAKGRGEDASKLIEEAKAIPGRIREKEDEMAGLRERVDHYLMRLPNVLHESVPVGASDEDNVVVREWGEKREFGFDLKDHGRAAVDLGVADFERAVKISGSGFYFLRGDLALLDVALQRYAIDLLIDRGYTLVEPPLMMRRKPYEGVTDLADFENVMYKVEDDDLYLIATSEHPLAAMHMDEVLDGLPLKYAGVSPCFRREIGKHGLDERGLFRVHQFNKIEQFVFCRPEDSWDFHEQLIANAEDLMQGLKIPYHVVNVCTGDIGAVAAKKYDLEGWSPREGKHIELMSCSNCTSYQAARLKIRHRAKDGNQLVHTLNSTMVATSRALRLILENYQEEDGSVAIPDVLRPYMNGRKRLT